MAQNWTRNDPHMSIVGNLIDISDKKRGKYIHGINERGNILTKGKSNHERHKGETKIWNKIIRWVIIEFTDMYILYNRDYIFVDQFTVSKGVSFLHGNLCHDKVFFLVMLKGKIVDL